jgi:hypothetical protein
MLKPYSTLAIGIVLGMLVVPKALRAVNVNVPGM